MPRLPFGPDAGYGWTGPVSSLSGSWTVPAIGSQSPGGSAGTWIGAAQISLAPVAPFIQVGTNEEEDVGPEYPRPLARYYAFWTDTAHGFTPISLFSVEPRDRVVARLVLAAGRWHISIEDARSGRAARLSTRDEATGAFGLAIWTQEDLTRQINPPRLEPYPELSAIRFDHLTINGEPLGACCAYATWMSLGSLVLRPTPLRDGSFALRLERPRLTDVQLRYLKLFGGRNPQSDPTWVELATATSDGSRSKLERAAKAYGRGLRQQIAGLRAGHWPAVARRSIDDFVHALAVFLATTNVAKDIAPTGFQAWRAAWQRDATNALLAGTAADRALDVPALQG